MTTTKVAKISKVGKYSRNLETLIVLINWLKKPPGEMSIMVNDHAGEVSNENDGLTCYVSKRKSEE